ncbi:hypothetical protein QBC34DRAFT_289147 [Podospora aff. communis PSN243]|uniref:DUF6590 domain-containing protein n=1 Tax=Podospora aff. communis PSN243 TaxID=3040156 RepID=A0AAV9H774_9PEZI|nr:hypothetical protein QBC34DRAFT_289147 [Podospora aff. communis PSN243]
MGPPTSGDVDTASDCSDAPNFHSLPPSDCPSPHLCSTSDRTSTVASHLFSTTHDSSSVGYHVTQASFTTQLDLALRALWATRHGCKYLDVQVLLFSWNSDDLGVADRVSGLESVFRDVYHYEVEWWKIPDAAPGRHATKKVIRFVEEGNDPNTLLILYYAGHATPNPTQPGGLPCWVANRTRNSPRFDVSCVQPHLCQVDDEHPDVLLLYDSCHPANGHGSVQSSRAVIELLAATGFESVAPDVGQDSFTQCLIQELSLAAERPHGISIPELHRRQICKLQSGDQKNVMMDRAEDGKMKVRMAKGAAIFETPRRQTPIHCQLSLNTRPRAVILAPLSTATTRRATDSGHTDAGVCSGDEHPCAQDTAPLLHTLLRVSLAGEFNEAEFKEWLCNAPDAVKGIRVLGVLPSCSTLLLIQVPIEVWDLLPPSPAISFISFIWVQSPATAHPMAIVKPRQDLTASQTSRIDQQLLHPSKGKGPAAHYSPTPSVPLPTLGTPLSVRLAGGEANEPQALTFNRSENENWLVEALNAVDAILPTVFTRLRHSCPTIGTDRVATVASEVLEILRGSPTSTKPADLLETMLSNSEVFKVLWADPTNPADPDQLSDTEERESEGQRFFVGVQRFIVIANDEGHCTCVPISTYQHRGCLKKGVKPHKHGIIYTVGSRPTPLPGEPELGYEPVRMALDIPSERLAREARVNYAKLVTVEHNVRVRFIGSIVSEDMDIVTEAVDKCWVDKNRATEKRRYGDSSSRRDKGKKGRKSSSWR